MKRYRLTKVGERHISNWILFNAKHVHDHVSWFIEAEDAAGLAVYRGEDVVLEMRATQTKSGVPETLPLDVEKYFIEVDVNEV